MSAIPNFSRRSVTGAIAAAGTLAMLGCGKSAQSQSSAAPGDPAAVPSGRLPMTVYRVPDCPCCVKWAAMAENAGYRVTMVNHSDMPSLKEQYRVPEELASCHTGIIDGFAIEGHVPFEHLARLLRERPAGIIGLAVAGMPAGSPGMETPDGTKEEFSVMAFDKRGQSTPFQASAAA